MDASRCSKCGHFSSGYRVEKVFDTPVPGTQHYSLLNSNEPPEDSEFSFIHSVVSDADARLARLDDEISKMQERLRLLKQERVSIFNYRTCNKAILSPLRRMPPEVLGEIFLLTLPSVRDELDRGGFDLTDSPWVLARISTRWRTISLSTPSLWSRILINYTRIRHRPAAYPLSLAKAQIQRAQKLKIHFYGSENGDSFPQIQMFQLLSQHSSRWDELSLLLTSKIVPHLSLLRDRLPLLRRIWIQWKCAASQAEVQSIDCFQTAPSLVDFGTINERRFVSFSLPVHQLTHYFLNAPWEEQKHILSLALNLVEAHITVNFDLEPWPAPNDPIRLSHLRGVYVSNPEILDHLVAPSLEGLALAPAHDETASEVLSHLEAFVDRSGCHLQKLYCRGLPDPETITRILQKFSSITELIMESNDWWGTTRRADDLMATFTLSSTAAIAPNLSRVVLACRNNDDDDCIDYWSYIRMVQSRWRAEDCALKAAALLIGSGAPTDRTTLLAVQMLREDGLDFVLIEGMAAMKEMKMGIYCAPWMI